ncbi:fliG middle domain protein [Brucella abortus]|nr:fliG middle domain protein [Brucella abortus]
MSDTEQHILAETGAAGPGNSIVDTLTGPQKAAAILVAIGRPAAARLLKHFNAEDLRKLAGHARTLEPISPLDFEQLVKQFEDLFAEGAPVSKAAQRFEGLLRDTLPQEEVDAVLEDRVQPQLVQESVWIQVARLPMESLQAYLGNQHPQIIAYIVSRLPSDLAARLFVALPPQLRNAVVQRCRSISATWRPLPPNFWKTCCGAIFWAAAMPVRSRRITARLPISSTSSTEARWKN